MAESDVALLPGVRVGHWTDARAETGCTLIELPEGTTASYEARGGAPAARELTLLEPDKTVATIDAVLLTGGSAFGLAAADGVMAHYEAAGRGAPTPAGRVPIVPTLGLFDLAAGDGSVRPGAAQGAAAAAQLSDGRVETGRVGAGAGAYVAQWRGPEGRRPGGFRAAEQRAGDVVVQAFVALNAFGDIDAGGPIEVDAAERLQQMLSARAPSPRAQTTIGVVVTNARLDKVGCRIVAQGAHDGLARAIVPAHTRFDGDAFIAAATGQVEADVDVVRLLAVAAVSAAINRGGSTVRRMS